MPWRGPGTARRCAIAQAWRAVDLCAPGFVPHCAPWRLAIVQWLALAPVEAEACRARHVDRRHGHHGNMASNKFRKSDVDVVGKSRCAAQHNARTMESYASAQNEPDAGQSCLMPARIGSRTHNCMPLQTTAAHDPAYNAHTGNEPRPQTQRSQGLPRPPVRQS